MSRVINEDALKRINEIHRLSSQVNANDGQEHKQKLLSLMKSHMVEIEQLSDHADEHFLVETGDLIILCLEMLLEHRQSIDAMLTKCFLRYENKLNSLMKEK